MDTVVDIQVVVGDATEEEAELRIDKAFEVFRQVELTCSRFSSDSEVMRACRVVGSPVRISPLLFEPLRLALKMAEQTEGRFDPTIGKRMETFGFNCNYLTGEIADSPADAAATYRDISIHEQERTLLLHKPLVIDLGAVAKGFAIDLAVQELQHYPGFVVNAGGDLYAGGVNPEGNPWRIGIQHPVLQDETIAEIHISNQAVCTSGSYERPSETIPGAHHIIDPGTRLSPHHWCSCSIIAPYTMMADVFSTAAFIMGGEQGKELVQKAELQGLFITSELQIVKIGGI